jgi:teichuronic acid biosynthesis glycosyltransferase TuaC
MKVLFISSGNSFEGISPIVLNQGESLKKAGIQVDYFTIQGKGAWGYIRNIPLIRKQLKNNYSLVHAHYSLSAFVATLAGAKPLIASLMGSDIRLSFGFRLLIKFFSSYFWKATIVKSNEMKEKLRLTNLEVIPNGVDMNKFLPLDRTICQKDLKWKSGIIHILFAANPDRPEKNFKLTKEAFEIILKDQLNMELHVLKNVPINQMPLYINAANVVVLSSLWEGSPNVIKEAMACNVPIVSTKVGDVDWLFGDCEGHFIASNDSNDFGLKLKMAIEYSQINLCTKGRNRLISLNLDSKSTASTLKNLYSIIDNENFKE